MSSNLTQALLELADDNLILGHRLSEWCGHAPMLEEDLALPNMGLDLIGTARTLYSYAGTIENNNKSEDDLAFLRDEREFLNCLLVERPNVNFAHTVLKQLYFSSLFSISPGYIGLSVTQSFGFGVPMIVSKHENHSPEIEAVKEGENAIYFQTDNVDNLCEKILHMYEFRDQWIDKRKNIVKDCQTNYSIEVMCSPFIEVYHQN